MIYDVEIRITQESLFSVEIEADSEVDAEDTAQGRIWNDSYTQELRASLEIVDESYEAEEQSCPECNEYQSECVCPEEGADK